MAGSLDDRCAPRSKARPARFPAFPGGSHPPQLKIPAAEDFPLKIAFLSIGLSIALAPLSLAAPPTRTENERANGAPLAIATFHCLGLYWSPPGGAADKEVLVRYRQQGAAAWKEALPMRYNPIPNTDEDLTDYRGSIVHLARPPPMKIQLTLAGTSTTSEPHRHDVERGVSGR